MGVLRVIEEYGIPAYDELILLANPQTMDPDATARFVAADELASLPLRKAPLGQVKGAIKARWVCEQAHQQLKEELGLDHFEGRSWTGLHRHALMAMIALAFMMAARFVSGYLYDSKGVGVVGGGATHAWCAIYVPGAGWVEFDPTNDQLADQRYITLAWGADFADVVPLRGVILGGGTQTMDVAVSVIPVA